VLRAGCELLHADWPLLDSPRKSNDLDDKLLSSVVMEGKSGNEISRPTLDATGRSLASTESFAVMLDEDARVSVNGGPDSRFLQSLDESVPVNLQPIETEPDWIQVPGVQPVVWQRRCVNFGNRPKLLRIAMAIDSRTSRIASARRS
jgi:hypothetical protein